MNNCLKFGEKSRDGWNHHPQWLLDHGFIIICLQKSFNPMNGTYSL